MTTEEQAIVRRILIYLVKNSNAEDTLEGIVRWWLLGKLWRKDQVAAALEKLVVQGVVRRRKIKTKEGTEFLYYAKIHELVSHRLARKRPKRQAGEKNTYQIDRRRLREFLEQLK